MSREPYEKPEARELRVGDLLAEASSHLHSACLQLEAAKVEADRVQTVVAQVEKSVAEAMLDFDKAKNVAGKIDTIITLTREANGIQDQG